MLLSMTGFGLSVVHWEEATVSVEVRSVNNRFLKVNIRLPEPFAGFEHQIEKLVRDTIRRGTVSVAFRIQRGTSAATCKLNGSLVRSLVDDVRRHMPELPEDKIALSLLTLPELFVQTGVDQDLDAAWSAFRKGAIEALDAMQAMRKEEGRSTLKELAGLTTTAEGYVAAIAERASVSVVEHRDRMFDRVQTLLAGRDVVLERSDLLRELSILAERYDIAEELARLRGHLEQLRSMLTQSESAGRTLDFLTQELHRETNTIGAKANDLEIARVVVDLKTAIERIREIVQNVE